MTTITLYLGFFSVNNCLDHEKGWLEAKVSLNPVASGSMRIGGGYRLGGVVGLVVTVSASEAPPASS